jgi:ankyrin repeat protein
MGAYKLSSAPWLYNLQFQDITALHVASGKGHAACVQLLLDHAAPVNARSLVPLYSGSPTVSLLLLVHCSSRVAQRRYTWHVRKIALQQPASCFTARLTLRSAIRYTHGLSAAVAGRNRVQAGWSHPVGNGWTDRGHKG